MIIDLTKKDDPDEKKKYQDYLKVCELVKEGKTYKQIARIMKVSIKYVEALWGCTMFI